MESGALAFVNAACEGVIVDDVASQYCCTCQPSQIELCLCCHHCLRKPPLKT